MPWYDAKSFYQDKFKCLFQTNRNVKMKVSYQLEANFRYISELFKGLRTFYSRCPKKKSKKDFVSSFKVNETQIYSP